MKILPYGDEALLVNFDQKIDPDINRHVTSLHSALKQGHLKAVTFLIPGYCSLVVGFDPSLISFYQLKKEIQDLHVMKTDAKDGTGRVLTIPVCYQPPLALDLQEVSAETGLMISEIIELHTNKVFRVYMLGFLPGFAYMGPLPQDLSCSRKATPRTRVPAGSVGLAGLQTGIYPADAPGGWQIIGQTPLPPFRGRERDPFLFQPGDQVRFQSVSFNEFNTISEQVGSQTFPWEAVYG